MTDAPTYVIVDSTLAPVGTLYTDPITGVVTATVQMPSEWPWERVLRAGWCDVNWDGHVNGVDFDLYMDWFVAGDRRADFDRDSFLTGVDVETFTEAFIAGGL